MATTSSSLPEEQQPQDQAVANPESVSSSSSAASGPIGPFFVVISVLAVLAILSCVLGRICCRHGAPTPLENIKHGGGCLGWVKRKCGRCMAGDDHAEVIMAKSQDGV